jgi:hypothetical protein
MLDLDSRRRRLGGKSFDDTPRVRVLPARAKSCEVMATKKELVGTILSRDDFSGMPAANRREEG